MWPWGHAAVAYLLYAILCRVRGNATPGEVAAIAAVVGALVPDLVDKPLAWWVPILPTGRTLGHSLLVAVPVLALLWWLAADRRPVVAALGVGWLSHSLVDAVPALIQWDVPYTLFLFWPATSTPSYPTEQSFLAHVYGLQPDAWFGLQLGLTVLALVVWRRDGYPGLAVALPRPVGGRPD